MPAHTRALWMSASASENDEKDLMVPGSVSESIVNDVSSPKTVARRCEAAPLSGECPDGYSGWAGVVPRNGVHVGSAPAGVPSGPDCWIAVTGARRRI